MSALLRQMSMLRLIPRAPHKITAEQLQEKLKNQGYSISLRSIQRDLQDLSVAFPLQSDERDKPFGWFWTKSAPLWDLPGMDLHTALAFHMTGELLRPIFPQSTLTHLQPHFDQAAAVLQQAGEASGPATWTERVRITHRGQVLQPPVVLPEVQTTLETALLENRQVRVEYARHQQTEARAMQLNPLGLVYRDGVFYLVATAWQYTEPRHYALHRMRTASLLDSARELPQGFELGEYVRRSFQYPLEDQPIALRLWVSNSVARYLQEMPLHPDQRLKPAEDGMLLSATLEDSRQLRWWLLGIGDEVEVLAPEYLRAYFAQMCNNLHQRYQAPVADAVCGKEE